MCIDFLWLKGDLEDPTYNFWLLQKEKCLSEKAYIVITDVKDEDNSWQELAMYDSIRFGTIVLVVYNDNIKPKVVPSQKGLYMQDTA